MKLPQAKFYVVTAPSSVRGIYDTWPACKAAVDSVSGALYQSAPSRDAAEAILRGESVALPVGVYAFIDGNHLGGVGVVFVMQRDGRAPVVKEISTSVIEVFGQSGIAGLESRDNILGALQQIKNILAELAGLYYVAGSIAAGTTFTLVHDYNGIAEWMTGRWRMKDPVVRDIIAACRLREMERGLRITFQHQRGHQAVSFNEWARYNARADALATQGGQLG
jgi:hypothetical protein